MDRKAGLERVEPWHYCRHGSRVGQGCLWCCSAWDHEVSCAVGRMKNIDSENLTLDGVR